MASQKFYRADEHGDNDAIPSPPSSIGQKWAPVIFKWYKFRPLKLRAEKATKVQLNHVAFYDSVRNQHVSLATCKATNPGGVNPSSEGPEKVLSSSIKTKWLDFEKNPLVLEFLGPTQITHFAFRTANDDKRRDPVRFALEGSLDAVTWHLLYEQDEEDYYVGRGKMYAERLIWSCWFCCEDRGLSGAMREQLDHRERYLCKAPMCRESIALRLVCRPKSHPQAIGYQWHYQLLAHLEQYHRSTDTLREQRALKDKYKQEDDEWRGKQSKADRCIYEGPQHVRPPAQPAQDMRGSQESAPKKRRVEVIFARCGPKKVRETASVQDAFRELLLLNGEEKFFTRHRRRAAPSTARTSDDAIGVPAASASASSSVPERPVSAYATGASSSTARAPSDGFHYLDPAPPAASTVRRLAAREPASASEGPHVSASSPSTPSRRMKRDGPTQPRSPSVVSVPDEDSENAEGNSDFVTAVHRFADTASMQNILAVLGDPTTDERTQRLIAQRVADKEPFPRELSTGERRKQIEQLEPEGRTQRWLWVLCYCLAYPDETDNASEARLDLLNVMLLKNESPWVCLFGVMRIVPSMVNAALREVMPFLGDDTIAILFSVRQELLMKPSVADHFLKGKRVQTTCPIAFCVRHLVEHAKGYNAAVPLGALFGYLLDEDDGTLPIAMDLGKGYLKSTKSSKRYATVACFLAAIIMVKHGGEQAMTVLRNFPRSENLDSSGFPVPAESTEKDLCRFWHRMLERMGVTQWEGDDVLLTAKNTPAAPPTPPPASQSPRRMESSQVFTRTQSPPQTQRPSLSPQLPSTPMRPASQVRMHGTPTAASPRDAPRDSQNRIMATPQRSGLRRVPSTPVSRQDRSLQEWDLNNIMQQCKEVFLAGIPKTGASLDLVTASLPDRSVHKMKVRMALLKLYHEGYIMDLVELGENLMNFNNIVTTEDSERRIIATTLDDLKQKAFTFDARITEISTFQNVGADDPAGGFYLFVRGAGNDTTSSRRNNIGTVRLIFSPLNKMGEKWSRLWVEFDKAIIRVKSPLKKTISEDSTSLKTHLLDLTVDEETHIEVLRHGISQFELSERNRKWREKQEARKIRSLAPSCFDLLAHDDALPVDIVGQVRHYRSTSDKVQIRVPENPNNLIVLLRGEQKDKFAQLESFSTVLLLTEPRVYNEDKTKNRLVAKNVSIVPHDDPRAKELVAKLKEQVSEGKVKNRRREPVQAGALQIYK